MPVTSDNFNYGRDWNALAANNWTQRGGGPIDFSGIQATRDTLGDSPLGLQYYQVTQTPRGPQSRATYRPQTYEDQLDIAAKENRLRPALTGDREFDTVLAGIPDASALAMAAANRVQRQYDGDYTPNYGRAGNEWHVGNQTFTGDDAAGEAWQRAALQRAAAQRMALVRDLPTYDVFANDPRVAAYPGAQRRALYSLAYGQTPEQEMKAQADALSLMKARRELEMAPETDDWNALKNIEANIGENPVELLQYFNQGTGTAELPSRMVRNPDPLADEANRFILMPARQVPVSPELFESIAGPSERRGLFSRNAERARSLLRMEPEPAQKALKELGPSSESADTPESIRAAYQAGKLTREQAKAALAAHGYK